MTAAATREDALTADELSPKRLGRLHLLQTVTGFPSKLVKVKPPNGSLYMRLWSRSTLMATASPSNGRR